MSRVGKRPIAVPAGVSVSLDAGILSLGGAGGRVERAVPSGLSCVVSAGTIAIASSEDLKLAKYRRTASAVKSMWGLFRQRVANDVKGLSEGFLIVIKIVGGGYKAAVSADGCSMTLSLGYSHELSLRVPEGVKVTCIKNAIIELRGADKRVLGDFAAALQLLRPADPYKQKGVIPQGAFVRKKKGKAN